MAEHRLLVLRGADAPPPPGPATAGMDRHEITEHDGTWIGWVRTDPGFAGGWHHHAERESWIYMISGEMTIDYGPGGRDSVAVRMGDFILVPPHVIHRETTPGAPAELIVVRIGEGSQNVNVDGPDD